MITEDETPALPDARPSRRPRSQRLQSLHQHKLPSPATAQDRSPGLSQARWCHGLSRARVGRAASGCHAALCQFEFDLPHLLDPPYPPLRGGGGARVVGHDKHIRKVHIETVFLPTSPPGFILPAQADLADTVSSTSSASKGAYDPRYSGGKRAAIRNIMSVVSFAIKSGGIFPSGVGSTV